MSISRHFCSQKLTSAQPLIRAVDTVSIGKGSFGQVMITRHPSLWLFFTH
jgi:hypothetical protein